MATSSSTGGGSTASGNLSRPLSMIAEGDNDQLPESSSNLARTYSEQSMTSSSNDEPSPAHAFHHSMHASHGSGGGATLADMARKNGGANSSASSTTDHDHDDGFRRIAVSDEDSPDPSRTYGSGHSHASSQSHNSSGSGSGGTTGGGHDTLTSHFRGRQGSDADNYPPHHHAVRLSGSTDDFSPFGTHSPSSNDGDVLYGRRRSLGDTTRPGGGSASSSRVPRQAFVDRDDHEVASRMRGSTNYHDDEDKHHVHPTRQSSGGREELSKADLLRLLNEKEDQLRSISLRQTAPSPGLPSIYGSSITVPPPLSMNDAYHHSSGASSVLASPAQTPSARGSGISLRPMSRLGRDDVDNGSGAAASLANFTRQLPELMSTSLPRVVDFSYSFIPAECINLWQAEPGTNELICRVTRNRSLDGVRVPLNGGICGYAAKIGRIVNLSNAAADWRFDPSIDTRPGLPTRSLLMVPVRTRKGQTSAILEAINCTRHDGGFNHDDETIMSVLAGCLSLMTENNEVGEELTLQRKQVEALHQIVDLTSSTALSIGNAIGKITRASHLVCHAERITIYLVDEVNRSLVPCGPGVANIPRLSLRDGIAGHVATTGQPANVPDTAKDWRFDSRADRASGFNTRSILAVPIKDHLGKTVAVMEACNRQQIRTPGGRGRTAVDVVPFSDDDVKMLISLASTAAGILRQAQLYDEAVSRRKQTEALLQINQLMQTEIGTDKVIPRITESAYKLINAERITLFTLEESPLPRSVGGTSLRHTSVAPPPTPSNTNASNLAMAAASFQLQSPRIPPPPQSPAASSTAVTPSRASFRGPIDDPRDRRELVCRVSRKDSLLGLRIKWGDGIVGHVASTLRTLNIPDAYQDSRFNKEVDRKTGFRTRAILTVPITDWEGKCVGVFQAVNKKTGNGVFSPEDEANLTHLATTAGIILRKSKLYEAALSAERKVKALMTVMQVVTNHDAPMQDVIYGILRVAADAINSDRVDIFFVDKDKMFTLAEGGLQIEFPIGFGVTGHCAATGEPVNIANAYDDSHFKAEFDDKLGYRTQSLLCMAVKDDDGKVLAVVRAANRRIDGNISSSTSGPSIIMPDSMEGVDLPHGAPVAVANTNNNASLAINTGATPRGSHVLPSRSSTPATATGHRAPVQPGLSISIDGNGRVHEEHAAPVHPSPFIADHEPLGDSSKTDRLFGRGKKADSFTAFTVEDEEILAALCYQIRATIRRYITDAMLEHYERGGQKDDRETGTHSIVSLYSSTPPSVKRNWSMLKRRPDLRRDVSYRWPDSTPKSALSTKLQDASLDNIAFNVWQHTDEDLLSYTVHIFEEMGLVEKFKLPPDLLKNFILAVRKNYDDNPFHNWKHGFSAFHFAYLTLRMTDASNCLQDQDVLGLLVGSLCHDIAHPGLTNTFEIASGSARALIYNDQSVLENHHANTMFSILQQPECNIFAHMKREQRQELRTIMIKAILATDMSFHFDEIKKMDAVEAKKPVVPSSVTATNTAPAKQAMPSLPAANIGSGEKKVVDTPALPPSSSFSASSTADRQFVVNMLIHTSDLSGQVFATVIAKEWEERLVREFSAQADKERKLNLPVAPFMTNLNDPYTRAKLQVNFIDFVLVPWWKSMTRIWPGLRSCEKQLRVNREFYSKLATVQESKEKPAATATATTAAPEPKKDAAPAAATTATPATATAAPTVAPSTTPAASK